MNEQELAEFVSELSERANSAEGLAKALDSAFKQYKQSAKHIDLVNVQRYHLATIQHYAGELAAKLLRDHLNA